jgi:hypothetical protein
VGQRDRYRPTDGESVNLMGATVRPMCCAWRCRMDCRRARGRRRRVRQARGPSARRRAGAGGRRGVVADDCQGGNVSFAVLSRWKWKQRWLAAVLLDIEPPLPQLREALRKERTKTETGTRVA